MPQVVRRSRLPRGAVLLACTAIVALLTGCTGSGPSPRPTPSPTGYGGARLTKPGEPGDAAPLTRAPAGRVIALPAGSTPWGVAIAPAVHRVYTALREPGRLAAVDTGSGRVQVVPMPGKARMIDLAGPTGPLLYPEEDRNRVLELDLPDLRQVASVATRRQPHQAVRVSSTLFVTQEFGHAVRVVRAGRSVAELDQPVQPGGITAVAGRVAAVDVAANLLLVWDAATLRLLAALPAGEGPSHVVPIGGSRVAVCDARGHQVLTYDIAGRPRALGRAAVPGRAFWIEADARTGTIYTALPDANLVARLRVDAAGRPHLDGTLPTVQQPISMDLDAEDGVLAVAGYASARLQIVPVTAFR